MEKVFKENNSRLFIEVFCEETENKTTNEEKENFEEIMALISEMNIIDFEPMLVEDLNSQIGESATGKYHILAILRDLFTEYKSSGDSQLIIELGTCGHICDRKCHVINLRGNKSGKNFAFGLDKSESNIVNFHICYGFVDKNNCPKYIDGNMMMNSLKKTAALKGKDTSRFGDKIKDLLMLAVKDLHKS